uniref:Peptidase A2 domain-containing protein n=2 Tax=Caenorhabditis japonica TaxID=281687 RepID=A0A8R1HH15_CAEJA
MVHRQTYEVGKITTRTKIEQINHTKKQECDEAEKLITEIAKFTPEQILENDDCLFTKINEMTSSIKATESALEKLAMTAEGLDPDNDVEQSKFEEQADKVNDVILRGVQARDKLMAQRERRLLIRNSQHGERVRSPRVSVSENASTPRRIRHLKIPKFSGDRWQWQNFWTIFEELIDKTEDSAILKFNELKNHLDGEAKELIEKYLVTEDNYALAINLLKERYDDSEATIAELNDRFKFVKATNTSISEQRKLWDKIHILLQQLDTLGENIDHYMVKDAIVEKFSYDIRKEIYERKYKLSDVNDWTIEQLIYDIEETIKHQEKLRKKLKLKDEENPKDLQRNKPKKYDEKYKDSKSNFQTKCLFCQGEHFSDSKDKHNASICTSWGESPIKQTENSKQGSKKPNKQTNAATILKDERDMSDEEIEERNDEVKVTTTIAKNTAYLPTLKTEVFNNNSKKWEPMSIMIDTGSDTTYVTKELLEKMFLPKLNTTLLKVRTFDDEAPKKGTF